ncbi:EamA family transporter [Lautropia mirabilis ATCC 51599]|jgi:hypothetical protein|uniref:Putative membrane protein n=1 Tax=Lautropia mirabilis ATCC 51599 TaxID=887898 RepID=E7RZW0_9BURK|nr:EamA family transporter [Lautropia mirabilis]EFV94109.1 putative membrane protein [Lautropia mirabilis ATCC 51599]VEG99807.1 Uncharacterized inner membrane transporter yiJE [Lautropia mirabilis]
MDVQDARLKRHAPWLMALLTLIWGTNWPVIALAVREVSAWTFRALTLPVAGILLLLLAHRRKLPLAIPRQHWPMLLCSAWAFLALWNVATTLALTYIPSGQAALLGFTMPLWAALWSWLLFGHTLDGRQWLALLLGTAGVIVLMIPAFASYAHAPLGLVYGLASGAGWALSTVLLKHRPIPVPTTVLTGWQLLLASVPVIIGAWLLGDHQWFMPSASSLAAFIYITLVPMLFGNLLWFSLIQWLPPQLVSLSPIMIPMVAMVSGAIVLNEPLGWQQWLAMMLSASGLGLMLFRRSDRS